MRTATNKVATVANLDRVVGMMIRELDNFRRKQLRKELASILHIASYLAEVDAEADRVMARYSSYREMNLI